MKPVSKGIPMEGSRSPLHRLRALNCTSGPYSYTKGGHDIHYFHMKEIVQILTFAGTVEERMRTEAYLEEMLVQKCC